MDRREESQRQREKVDRKPPPFNPQGDCPETWGKPYKMSDDWSRRQSETHCPDMARSSRHTPKYPKPPTMNEDVQEGSRTPTRPRVGEREVESHLTKWNKAERSTTCARLQNPLEAKSITGTEQEKTQIGR